MLANESIDRSPKLNNRPLVSVLIPAYNVGPYIRECLDSVLRQTLQDFEIVCIDDKSTDNTLEILREYQAADARIHVYCHERNKGQSCGRNLALSHALGKYVYMLDADDMIEPFMLKELTDLCQVDDLDLVGFETKNFAEDPAFQSNVEIPTITYQNTAVLSGREALCYCMEEECFSLSTPTFLMRREYLTEKEIRFQEGILHEDVGYIFELVSRAERVRFLHKVYFLRRIRAHSTMTKGFTAKNIEGYLKSFYRSFELEPELGAYRKDDPRFAAAVGKWQRDVYWRMRQLYKQSIDNIMAEDGGHVSEEIRRAFETVKLAEGGNCQPLAFDSSVSNRLRDLPPEVYLCGMGSYTERAIQIIGRTDTIIRGILVLKSERKAFRGYPVLTIDDKEKGDSQDRDRREVVNESAEKDRIQDIVRNHNGRRDPDPAIPVIRSVSHYSGDAYEHALKNAGIQRILYMDF